MASTGRRTSRAAQLARRIAAATTIALALVAGAAPASAAPDEAEKRALVLFDRGKLAYKEGRFDESVLLLKEAYAIKAEPILLYNIARAHEAQRQFPEAVAAYERYLTESKDPPDKAEVEQKIGVLRAAIDEAKREADAAEAAEAERKAREERERAAAQPEPPPPDREPNLVPWVVAGSGAAVMGVGVVFGALALGENGDAEDAPSQVEAVDARDGAETLALVSTITLIVGGAALAGGATWGVIDLTSGGASSDRGGVDLRIQGSGAAIHGAF